MSLILDGMDDEIYENIKKYLDTHENSELDTLLDNINSALASDIYPREEIYKAEKLLKELKQVERIKALDERVAKEEKRYEMLSRKKESLANKKGSHI